MSRARELGNLGRGEALYVDNSTNNVGVGSTSPSSKLDVRGTAAVSIGAGVTIDGVAGVLTATSFVGDGALIRNIPANRVGGATSVGFNDGIGAYWGAQEDLEIIHDGSNSYIRDKVTGSLILSANAFYLKNAAENETGISWAQDGGVDLLHDNTSRISTSPTGGVVAGILTATTNVKVGDHIALDHAAAGGTVTATHFSGNITGTAATFTTVSVAGTITHEDVTNIDSVGIVTGRAGLRATAGGIEITAGIATFKSGVDLQFEGNAAGVTSAYWDSSADTLKLLDSTQLRLGDGGDLSIYHDGENSTIKNVSGGGVLTLKNEDNAKLQLMTQNSYAVEIKTNAEDAIICNANGSVELYYDTAKKLETTTAGVVITGICTAQVPNAPQNSQGSSYTLVKSDAGKHVYSSNSIECPANVFAAGDLITIYNNSGSNKTITQGTSLTMYLSDGEGNSGTRTLKQRCVCTVLYTSTTEAVISGGGLE